MAEGARFENPDALETIGRDLLSSDQFGQEVVHCMAPDKKRLKRAKDDGKSVSVVNAAVLVLA